MLETLDPITEYDWELFLKWRVYSLCRAADSQAQLSRILQLYNGTCCIITVEPCTKSQPIAYHMWLVP